ncbi:ABC transporter substrate-binding protein [Streptomyces sp. 1222.5]|uniref:ABC transporter substrate-binding protein n=1 Tax=Streptomyces sp. 1222.5 TaxID=1881026 RepID=UPI003EBF75E3
MRYMHPVLTASLTGLLFFAVTGCTGPHDDGNHDRSSPFPTSSPSLKLPDLNEQNIQVAAAWTGEQETKFKEVLQEFEKLTGAKTTYVRTGGNVPAFLDARLADHNPPDVAFLSQPEAIRQLAHSKRIQPANKAVMEQLNKNYRPVWRNFGRVDGKQYGVFYKVTNKSMIWYNSKLFDDIGVAEPQNFKQFMTTARTVASAGTPALSVAGADGRTLADWFENIYLSQSGPEKYDQLTMHKIPWTDPSVKSALTVLGEIFGGNRLIPKDNQETDATRSITQIFTKPPKAAMVLGGDLTESVITSQTKANAGQEAKAFPFPAFTKGGASTISGGDAAVAVKGSQGAQALLAFLASTNAAEIRAKLGDFISPNGQMAASAYIGDIPYSLAAGVIAAGDNVRFDMSDQAPPSFIATQGAGLWKELQGFVKNPRDISGTQVRLEADATKAYQGSS